MVCSESHFGGATAPSAAQGGRGGRQAAPPGPHIVALSRKDQRQQNIALCFEFFLNLLYGLKIWHILYGWYHKNYHWLLVILWQYNFLQFIPYVLQTSKGQEVNSNTYKLFRWWGEKFSFNTPLPDCLIRVRNHYVFQVAEFIRFKGTVLQKRFHLET